MITEEANLAAYGIDAGRLLKVDQLLGKAREEAQFSGAAWAITCQGAMAASGTVGTQGGEPDSPATLETLFDVASLTKPLATAASILSLLDEGELLLDDEIRRYLLHTEWWQGVTLRHLLTHTSGLPPYAPLHETCQGGEAIRDRILQLTLQQPPGEKYNYSCLGYILLQHVLQAVTGQDLARFASKTLYEPLGMSSTLFKPPDEWLPRTASAGHCPHRDRSLRGEVHDPLAWAAGGVSGNAGLFSTVMDISRFGSALLDAALKDQSAGTTFAGRGLWPLSPAASRLMLTNQLDPAIGGQSCGLFTYPNAMLPLGELLPQTSIGHTGFTGTSLLLVPGRQLVIVLLANRLYYSSNNAFLRTRRLFHTLIGAAVG